MEKTEVIVLYSFPYKDKKFMLEAYSKQHGRMTFTTNRKLQPLSIVEITYEGIRTRAVSVEPAYIFRDLNNDPYKISIGFFIAEFLRYTTRNEPANTHLYEYIKQAVIWLDMSNESFANFHLVFTVRLTLFIGISPDVESYREGSIFDMREARFVTVHPNHSDVLSPSDSKKTAMLMRMSFATMHLFRLSHGERNAAIDRIIQYYRLHIYDFPRMKSLDVLRELF